MKKVIIEVLVGLVVLLVSLFGPFYVGSIIGWGEELEWHTFPVFVVFLAWIAIGGSIGVGIIVDSSPSNQHH